MKALAVLVIVCGVASADEGAVLVAQPVRTPVALGDVQPIEPFVPAKVPEVTGAITVGPDRAAALWIDPLDVIAVRHASGAKLQFARVVGEGGARATIAETGNPVTPELVYLTQLPGKGDVWTIRAEAPTTIVVERPVVRSGRMIWETTQRAVLAWIDRGGKRPELPITDGSGMLGALLDAYATVGAAIEASDGKLRGAVRAWRKAHAIAGITAVRPFVAPQLAVKSLDSLSGMGSDVSVVDPDVAVLRPYHRISGPRTLGVELTGPGALRVELRGVLPPVSSAASLAAPSPKAAQRPLVAVGVAWSGRVLAQRSLPLGYATAPMPTPPAFPHAQPLVSQEGLYLGDRVAVTIPLFPGTHHYDIVIDGGELAMRATVAQRRVTLGELLTGVDDVDRYAGKARRAIGGNKSPAAELVRRLVATLDGSSAQLAAPPQALPALLRLAWLATNASKDGSIDARAMTVDERAAAWTIVADAARHAKNPAAVAKLVAALPGEPPAVVIPSLVMSLPRATAIERIRNWRLSAIDLARRAKPLDAELAFVSRTAWRGGEWALIPPTSRDASTENPQPQRWLVETTPSATEPPRSWRPGDLWSLAVGKSQQVDAVPSTIDASRAAVLDIYVAAPRDADIHVVVDGERFDTKATLALERLQLGVAPGRHTVQLQAPATTRAWISHAPTSAVRIADTAHVKYLWPIEGVRTTLPDDARSSPIDVVLHAVTDKTNRPTHVVMKSDVGAPLEIELAPGAGQAHPIAGSGTLGGEVQFAVRLAPGARQVWFETAEPGRVLAAVYVRRERADATLAPALKTAPPGEDAIARLAKASEALATDPDDARMRAERASNLLDLGEPTLAREDLLRLLRTPAQRRAASAPLEDELFARLEGYLEPTHVALAAPPARPVALSASLVGGEHYRAARALIAAGDEAGGAAQLVDLYQREGKWQVAFEAIDVLARMLATKAAAPGTAALAYGLAARLRTVLDHPRVRRTLVVAAAQSGWDTILSTTANGGQETVFSPEPILPPAPPVVIREALIAPPWPARAAHTITASTTAVLDLDVPSPTAIRAQVKCVRTIEPEQPSAACTIGARIDQSPEKELPAQPGRVADLDLGTLPAGHHVVEVSLASEGDIASVRFVSDRAIAGITDAAIDGRHPIRIERRAKVFVATPKAPIAATVLGKTTLWVQARSLGQGARTVQITATPASGAAVRTSIELSRETSTAHGDGNRDLVLSAPADAFLLLPEGGPYQVRVESPAGDVVARIARREERKGKVPRVPQAWYLAAASTPAPFAVPAPAAIGTITAEHYAEPDPSALGTLSIEVDAGREALPEEDLLPARALSRIDTAVGFRRMLSTDRAWFTLRALGRTREDTAFVAGGASDLYLDHLPLGLAMQVGGSAFTQAYSDGRAWHVRGDAELMRRFAATSTLTVMPSIGFAASYLNTTPETVAVTMDEIDPDVFTAYRYTHDRAARARLALRWMPLQDFVGGLSVGGATNADLGSMDYVDAQVRTQHLLPLANTLVTLGYRPRYRFSGDDRAESFLQHYLTARLEWSLWTGGTGRFVVAMWNELDLLPSTNRNAFGAGIRYELLGHRGLVDRSPDDLVFGSLIDRRDYAPLEAP